MLGIDYWQYEGNTASIIIRNDNGRKAVFKLLGLSITGSYYVI